MAIYVDHTHLGRHVTGLERITLELFSPQALAPLDIVPVTARGTRQMVAKQTFELPMRLAASSSILLCPGFPPSPLLRPFASRVLPYIHDIFLLSRPADLNRRARLYMAAPFRLALHRYPRFLVNSSDTGRKLAAHCRPDAAITLYRPPVRNVFDLESNGRAERDTQPLRLVALGTVEPRKNFVAAARITSALRARGFPDATLDIVGRRGWGDDWRMLEAFPGVTLHGYQPFAFWYKKRHSSRSEWSRRSPGSSGNLRFFWRRNLLGLCHGPPCSTKSPRGVSTIEGCGCWTVLICLLKQLMKIKSLNC